MAENSQLKEVPVNLTTIGNGAALELFDFLWPHVLESARDINTKHDAKRKLMLIFDVEVSEDREQLAVQISAKGELPGRKPVLALVYVGKKDGKLVSTILQRPGEGDPRQSVLMFPAKMEVEGG